MDLKCDIDKAVIAVTEELIKLSKPCTTSKEIAQVGAISANADTSTGDIIASAMDKVGTATEVEMKEKKASWLAAVSPCCTPLARQAP